MSYDAAGAARQASRRSWRGPRKLVADAALTEAVHAGLAPGWSPEQIARRLKQMPPNGHVRRA